MDTPLLVYQAITNHPAKPIVEDELRHGVWGSTVFVLSECFQILSGQYALTPEDAEAAVDRLARSPLHWAAADLAQVTTAVRQRSRHRLQTADAVLLLLAQDDRGVLVSQDRRLLRVAQAEGIAVRNPISPALASDIARWETQHLPDKGLPRVLAAVERWLRREDAQAANRFFEATAQLTTLPS
ncbi:MAG: hypothetical protein HY332_16035 [Chloroflexi bacterium]|nr:hypothetical protein [Chloroflexota bacterium]